MFSWFRKILLTVILLVIVSGCEKFSPTPTPTQPTSFIETAVVLETAQLPMSEKPANTESQLIAAPLSQRNDGVIVFDGGDGIYWLDVEASMDAGDDVRTLLVENAFSAAFSPDGTQIAFTSNWDGNAIGIFLMPVPGSQGGNVEPRRLGDNDLGGIEPTWSPDGSQIAFVDAVGGNWEIFVINIDGSGLRQLTYDSAIDGDPQWSPDGNQLVFMSERGGNADIYLIDVLDDSEPVNLTHHEAVDSSPDWSPDGSQIVFYSTRDDGYENIFIMDCDGSNIIQVTDNPASDWHPDWSPDGSWIAFTSYRSNQDGDADIYVMALDQGLESQGNLPQRLTYSPSHDENAEWYPLPEWGVEPPEY